MSFRRGVTLPVAATLGHSESSDLGPTAGNGFRTRWPDDLASLAELGATDVRVTVDWSRLQRRPGTFDPDWAEFYAVLVDAVRALGMSVWVTMHDGGVPRWFDEERRVDEDEATVRWWPRWVERVAEHLGDRVDGWIPFASMPSSAAGQAWIDTWGILGGGGPPVAASVSVPDAAGRGAVLAPRCDLLGAALAPPVDPDAPVHDPDGESERWAERWAEAIVELGDVAGGRPVIVSDLTIDHGDGDVRAAMAGALVSAVEWAGDAVAGGVGVAFVGPAIAGGHDPAGLLDEGRGETEASRRYIAG